LERKGGAKQSSSYVLSDAEGAKGGRQTRKEQGWEKRVNQEAGGVGKERKMEGKEEWNRKSEGSKIGK
jgi:hypothetical protein